MHAHLCRPMHVKWCWFFVVVHVPVVPVRVRVRACSVLRPMQPWTAAQQTCRAGRWPSPAKSLLWLSERPLLTPGSPSCAPVALHWSSGRPSWLRLSRCCLPPPSSSPPPSFPLCNVVLCHLLAHHALAGVPCSRPSPLHCFSAFGWGAPLALSQAAAAALNRSTHSEAKSSRTRRDRADAAAAATAAAQTDVALHVAAAEERLQAQRVALERREREVSAREERAASALAEVEHKRRQVLEAEGVRGVVVVLSSGSCWV